MNNSFFYVCAVCNLDAHKDKSEYKGRVNLQIDFRSEPGTVLLIHYCYNCKNKEIVRLGKDNEQELEDETKFIKNNKKKQRVLHG